MLYISSRGATKYSHHIAIDYCWKSIQPHPLSDFLISNQNSVHLKVEVTFIKLKDSDDSMIRIQVAPRPCVDEEVSRNMIWEVCAIDYKSHDPGPW